MTYLVENLPNVCIKRILLDNVQESDSLYKVVVDVSVKVMDQSNRWIDDDFMVKHLNLMVVLSSDDSFNTKVTDGAIRITGDEIKAHLRVSPEKSIKVKQAAVRTKKTTIEEAGSAVFTFEFMQNHNANDLRVFAMTSVNMSELCAQYGGDPMVGQGSEYYGSITSEAIFKNGVKASTATVFQLGGEPYIGPVHQHGQTFMVGSQHLATPHATLTTMQVPNLKLKDNRTTSYATVNTISSEYDNLPAVSELYTTFGSNSSIKGIFSINIEQLMLTRTKYGKSFYGLSDYEYNTILSSFYIKNIKLYRKRVITGRRTRKVSRVLNRQEIAHTKDVQNENNLISIVRMDEKSVSHGKESIINVPLTEAGNYSLDDYRHVSTLKEENVFNKNKIRTFSFVDNSFSTSDGTEYCYEIKVEFVDATIMALHNAINKMTESISKLERYIYLSGQHKNYDFHLKKMKSVYISGLDEQYPNLDSAPWIEAPATYAKYLSYLRNISEADAQSIAKGYSNFLIPETFDITSAKVFLATYRDFIFQFRKKFNLSSSSIQGNTIGRTQKVFQNKNASDLLLEHSFSKITRVSEIDLGYEILDFEEGIELATITKQTFETMVSSDNDKFFEGQLALSKEEITALSEKDYVAYQDFKTYRPSYLSPRMLKKGRNTIRVKLTSLAKADHLAISRFSKKRIDFFTKRFFTKKRLSIDAINKSEEPDIDFVKAEKYFGIDSKFVTTDNLETEKNKETSYNAPPMFKRIKLLSQASNTRSNFDILSGDVKIPDNLPNQIKSLIGSRSRSSKNSFLDSDVDVLKMPQTSDSVEMMFFSLQRVMYCNNFSGIGVDRLTSRSYRQIKKPIWKILDQEALNSLSGPVLCKTEYYEPSGMNISIGDENKFNVYNNLFIIDFPNTIPTPAEEMTINQMLQSQYLNVDNDKMIEYSTTNIMKQPSNVVSGESSITPVSAPGTGTATTAASSMGGTGGSGMGGGMTSGGGGYGY